ERQKALADSIARARRSEGRAAEALEAESRSEEISRRVEEDHRRAASLEVTAPEEGILLTPGIEDLVGAYRSVEHTSDIPSLAHPSSPPRPPPDLERQKALADSIARARRSEGRAAEALEAESRSEEISRRVEEDHRRAASLEVTAPEEGILLTPGIEDLVGTY